MPRTRPTARLTPTPQTLTRWLLLALDDATSTIIDVGERLTLASGAELIPSEGRLALRPGSLPMRLNDVELRGSILLRAGDQIGKGQRTYLVLTSATQPSVASRQLGHAPFLSRLEEEVSGGREVTLVLARSAAFRMLTASELNKAVRLSELVPIYAQPTPELIEVLILSEQTEAGEDLRQALGRTAEGLQETVQWGTSRFPQDGGTPEELWAVAVERLLGLETPVPNEFRFADPSMVRLWSLAEAFARMPGPLIVVGAGGVGRETIARRIRALTAPRAPFVVHAAAKFDRRRWEDDVLRANGGALHVRYPARLPDAERAFFLSARQFTPSANFDPTDPRPHGGVEVFVPSLHDRTADLPAICEDVLHLVDARLARRRTTIRSEVRQAVQALPWTENVRSLKNAIVRAALSQTGSELRVEHFDQTGFSLTTGVESLRAQLENAERRVIEEALRQTRWNVSESARLMRLPRRTFVYRMRRLGIRRPA